jgi:hypothetical protein
MRSCRSWPLLSRSNSSSAVWKCSGAAPFGAGKAFIADRNLMRCEQVAVRPGPRAARRTSRRGPPRGATPAVGTASRAAGHQLHPADTLVPASLRGGRPCSRHDDLPRPRRHASLAPVRAVNQQSCFKSPKRTSIGTRSFRRPAHPAPSPDQQERSTSFARSTTTSHSTGSVRATLRRDWHRDHIVEAETAASTMSRNVPCISISDAVHTIRAAANESTSAPSTGDKISTCDISL